jgi:putative chitinase
MAKYIEVSRLVAAGVHPTQARIFAGPLDAACERFDITTRERIAAFLAQGMHESANFTRLEEGLFYTTPERIRAMFPSTVKSLEEARALVRNPKALANRVYANRNGNGPEATGDGWLYRGRGIFQTTGKANYRQAAQITGQPLLARPDLLLIPEHAAMSAAGYWNENNCNRLADANEFDRITKAVNGPAMAGREDRRKHFEEAMEAFA